MQVREPRMAETRASAVIGSSENFSSCVGREKFFSLDVWYEKQNFRLFRCAQPLKIITFSHYDIWKEGRDASSEKITLKTSKESWSNVPAKLLSFSVFLYKVVHKTAIFESSIAFARLNFVF